MAKPYSLRKCQSIARTAETSFKRLQKRLSSELLHTFEESLDALEQAIREKDLTNSRILAFKVEDFLAQHAKKSLFEHAREFVFAVIFALIIATIVRMMWFELYEIPSGSMRPTFLESDRVLVFKDDFCVNIPLETAHFLFQPEYVHRGTIIVLTGDKLDLPDVDTVYFGLFPGKRRYVKRCAAKDGDTIYFYGGKLFGIDKDGKEVDAWQSELFSHLEYIPFINLEGKVSQKESQITMRQMNIPVAEFVLSDNGTISGHMLNDSISFGELWGLGNFAMCRLLEPSELPAKAKTLGYEKKGAKLYLECKHSPKLPQNRPLTRSAHFSLLDTSLSWIPLTSAHCEKIKQSLYTARFFVRKGQAFPYTPEGPDLSSPGLVLDPTIADGCYEFLDGIAYEVGFGAIQHRLAEDNPLYPHSTKLLKALYNGGIDFIRGNTSPRRYAYFRDGSFYTLGKKLFEKDDKSLLAFSKKELQRASVDKTYTPFQDHGAPMKDGSLDLEFIRKFGLKIEPRHYLALGDNHAMSNDSRFFGAVPEKNLQGSPALIFWPPSSRWGAPPQPSNPFFRESKMIIWALAIVAISLSVWFYNRRETYRIRRKKPAGQS